MTRHTAVTEVEAAEAVPAMQDLSAALWSQASWWHAGQLAWDHATPQAQRYQMAIVEAEGRPVAWARIADGTHLQAQTSPGVDVSGTIVEWFEDTATSPALTAEVSVAEEELLAALQAHGFVEDAEGPFSLDLRRPAAADAAPAPSPDGYHVRPAGDGERERAVAAHRAAWRPSELPFHPDHRPAFPADAESSYSVEVHARMAATWPYRADLDLVVVALDGSLVGSCIAWLDLRTGAAEIEPLGIAPDHRGRGLAQRLVHHATAAVADLGGTEMVIQPRGDDAYPVPRHVYASCGFQRVNRTRLLTRGA